MIAIFSIAATTFRESIRNRTVLAIFVLALAFVASALLLAKLALDERVRVVKDWGLFCVSIFGVMLAILTGVSQVQREVKRKNLYVVLSRPIYRAQYVVGKYLGLAATLVLQTVVLSAGLVLLLWSEGVSPDDLLLKALTLSLVEVLLVAALAVFFASFSSPYLSGFFTLGIFLAGRSLPAIAMLSEKTHSPVGKSILAGIYYALPDLSSFNLSVRAVHGLAIPAGEALAVALHGLAYLVLLLVLATWIFGRRDLV